MDKLEYIAKQFSKARKKKYEHYVVTRIWHLLNDLSVKFVTQQYVSRSGTWALTDMFFPQLQIHIEVDEKHHENQIEKDAIREKDIINATGHKILRIDVSKDIETINTKIKNVVNDLKEKKTQIEDFKVWDIEAEQNPETYIQKGKIELKDDCAFRTMTDAASCFGKKFTPKSIWRGGVGHPKEPQTIVWFPKLYKNDEWNNTISNNEEEIREICEDPEKAKQHIDEVIASNIYKRIVFPRVKGPLGDVMYRFKGKYQLDSKNSDYKKGLLWKRISKVVATYDNNV